VVKPLNDVIAACPPSGIRKFFDIAAERADVISLGVGEPDFVTPWRVREAGIFALEHGYTTYTSNAGLPRLRELICADLAARYGTAYRSTDECLITTGVSEGLDLALRVLLTPGDEVIVPEPCYVAYEPCIAFAGGVPVRVPTRWEDGFAVDASAMEVTARTKAILLGSPANPTGAVQPCAAGGARPARRAPRPLPALRRDLRPAHLRHPAHLPGRPRAGPDGAARRVLQGPRDDRMAGRLDLRAARGRRALRARAPVHDALRAARLADGRRRGAVRARR
jgi:hypothetical protein